MNVERRKFDKFVHLAELPELNRQGAQKIYEVCSGYCASCGIGSTGPSEGQQEKALPSILAKPMACLSAVEA